EQLIRKEIHNQQFLGATGAALAPTIGCGTRTRTRGHKKAANSLMDRLRPLRHPPANKLVESTHSCTLGYTQCQVGSFRDSGKGTRTQRASVTCPQVWARQARRPPAAATGARLSPRSTPRGPGRYRTRSAGDR